MAPTLNLALFYQSSLPLQDFFLLFFKFLLLFCYGLFVSQYRDLFYQQLLAWQDDLFGLVSVLNTNGKILVCELESAGYRLPKKSINYAGDTLAFAHCEVCQFFEFNFTYRQSVRNGARHEFRFGETQDLPGDIR